MVLHLADDLRSHWESAASEYDITGGQAGLLMQLTEPMPMHQLAAEMTCRPSNLTGMIDRLEETQLVVRQPDEADRRVKNLVVTNKGQDTRSALRELLTSGNPFAARLNDEQLAQLHGLLAKLVEG